MLKRGNVTANLGVKRQEQSRLVMDSAALEQALVLAMDLHMRIPGSPAPRAEALLALPGVLRTGRSGGYRARRRGGAAAPILAGFAQALDALAAARRAEGARLAAALPRCWTKSPRCATRLRPRPRTSPRRSGLG